jgi:competence protein ComEC
MHAILNNFRPAEAWISALPDDSDEARLIAYAKTLGMAVRPYFAGDSFSFGGTSVRVLSPAPGYKSLTQPKNNDSMVLHIRFGETSVLLEADAEKGVERNLASEEPRADLIRIAHNGSTTSSTPIFLEAVQPKWAVISVGARSTFGHPRREVLERLERMHVRTYRTDLDGAVTFYLDGTSVSPALAVPR